MFNDLEENKIYFNPGDLVAVKHDIPNKPVMFVLEKCTRSLYNRDTQETENVFLGIKCRWFDKNQVLQEALFSTKDLMKL